MHETAKATYSTIQSINTKLEGTERRLLEEKDLEYLRSLNATDSRIDKLRIEDIKGGLLRDAYKWTLQNKEYLDWRCGGGRLLWIRGDPGKGKTMLLCGIINELESEQENGLHERLDDRCQELDKKPVYFFCQATNSANNSASAVLRGLIYSILQRSPLLINKVRGRLDECSNIEAANTLYILIDVFEILLQNLDFCILIDALDECIVHRDKLLEVICKSAQINKSCWIVTSRNWNDIGQRFNDNLSATSQLSLELNAESVSQAVIVYINHEVAKLASSHKYDDSLRDFVRDYLVDHAGGTFLWVALVCARLARVRRHRTIGTLAEYATGLDEVYDRMITMIEESSDEDILKQILRTVSIVFEPIHLNELPNLTELPVELCTNITWLEELISDCGSFLNVRGNRIEFVHQSAKDYIDKRLMGTLTTKSQLHFQIYNGSIQALSQTLRRDLYDLRDPGIHVEDIAQPSPDPLTSVRYCCIYWFQHLKASFEYRHNGTDGLLHFLKQRYLYWLEAMALLRSLHKVFYLLQDLEILVTDVCSPFLWKFFEVFY